MSIGENIKRFRFSKKISQRQLAKTIGTNQCFISRIENNKKKISLSRLIQLANIFECSLDDLIGRDEKND